MCDAVWLLEPTAFEWNRGRFQPFSNLPDRRGEWLVRSNPISDLNLLTGAAEAPGDPQPTAKLAPLLVPFDAGIAALNIKPTNAYALIRRGELTAVKVGNRTMFATAELERFAATRPRALVGEHGKQAAQRARERVARREARRQAEHVAIGTSSVTGIPRLGPAVE